MLDSTSSVSPGETRSDAIALVRRYLRLCPARGGLLQIAFYVTGDGKVWRATSRWDALPDSLDSPWPFWDEIV